MKLILLKVRKTATREIAKETVKKTVKEIVKKIVKKVAKEIVKAATKAAVKVIEGMGIVIIIIMVLKQHCLHRVWLL